MSMSHQSTVSPPSLWGWEREGGTLEDRLFGFPPPLPPPRKGEGNRDGGGRA